MNFEESTITKLYQNSVLAFPQTQMRQHATNPIKIVHLEWIPYVGMKTLYVKGIAHNEERTYNPVIVIKGVKYQEEKSKTNVPLIDNMGKKYLVEQMSFHKNDVLVRCNCGDHFWRFRHYNKLDKSLQGPDRKKYEAKHNPGSANPMQLPGMCKHLMKLAKVLDESGIIIQ